MTPDFALALSHDSVALLHRDGDGWRLLGTAPATGPNSHAALERLRRKGAALAPDGLRVKLVIPTALVRFVTLDTAAADPDEIRDAVAAAGGDDPDACRFDTEIQDGQTRLAVVAEQTLQEAETFAARHRFNPVSFVALPQRDTFTGEVFFGPTRIAPELIGADIAPARDTVLPMAAVPPLRDRIIPEYRSTPRAAAARPVIAPVGPAAPRAMAAPLAMPPAAPPWRKPVLAGAAAVLLLGLVGWAQFGPAPDETAPATTASAPVDMPEPVATATTPETTPAEVVAPDAAQTALAEDALPEAEPAAPAPEVPLVLPEIAEIPARPLSTPEDQAAGDTPPVASGLADTDVSVPPRNPPAGLGAAGLAEATVSPNPAAQDPEAATATAEETTTDTPATAPVIVTTGLPDLPLRPRPQTTDTATDTSPVEDGALVVVEGLPALPVRPRPATEPTITADATDTPVVTEAGAVVYQGLPDLTVPARPAAAAEAPAEDVVIASGTPAVLPVLRPFADAPEDAETEITPVASLRPRARPAGLVPAPAASAPAPQIDPEVASVIAAIAENPAAAAFVTPTRNAVPTSRRPDTRPRNFARVVANARDQIARQQQAAAQRQAAARQPAPRPAPEATGPTPGGVARAATIDDAIRLRELNLIGVFGRPNNRRALVRLSNGRVQSVEIGSRLDGGRVTAIGDSALNYVKGGRTYALQLPSG